MAEATTGATRMTAGTAVLDLPLIEATLLATQGRMDQFTSVLSTVREKIDFRIVGNMLAGYAYVDWMAAANVDAFAMGSHRHLLELNCLVLCGTDRARREEHAGHIAATQKRFYEEPDAGIEDVVEWLARNPRLPVWERAAGVYVRILSKPQLFIEGNHRTGALIMSHMLVREGLPPFVLTPDNAARYFAPSGTIRDLRKGSLIALFQLPRVRKRFARFVREVSDPQFLCRGSTCAAAGSSARLDLVL